MLRTAGLSLAVLTLKAFYTVRTAVLSFTVLMLKPAGLSIMAFFLQNSWINLKSVYLRTAGLIPSVYIRTTELPHTIFIRWLNNVYKASVKTSGLSLLYLFENSWTQINTV